MSNRRATEWSATVEATYRDQGRELWALFYAQCSDPERAQDALHEAFTRLQQQNGAEIRDVRAWLLRVGRNWLRDVARRQKVAAKPADYLDDKRGDAAEPAALLEDEESRSQVRAALEELKEEERQILALRYALNWSSQRIAATLDISTSAVDMRLTRARQRLGKQLEKRGLNPS